MSRLSITFKGRAAQSLNRLAVEGRSKTDVIREALVLEEVFIESQAQGSKLIVKAKDGTEREIVRA